MDSQSSLSHTFDLNSQKGVMALLSAVRQSALSNAEKNDLRDLVFLYTNGGGDVSVKIALEQKLRTHQIQPVAPAVQTEVNKPESKRAPLPFGSSRPAPVFVPPTVSKSVPKPEVREVKPEPQQPTVAKEKEEKSTTPFKPRTPISTSSPTPTPTPTSAPAESPKTTERQESKTQAAPETKTPPTQNTNVYLDRIREIKAEVNTKVGNPVNLVDIDNQVGREYMSALLEAMKRLSGGQPGGMEVAMNRLENAYVAVKKAVVNHQEKQKSEPVATPPAAPPPAANVAPPPQRPEPAVSKPTTQDLPEVPQSRPAPQPAMTRPVNPAPKAVPVPEPAVRESVRPTPVPTEAASMPTPPRPPAAPKAEPVTPVERPSPTALADSPWSTPADFAAPAVAVKSENKIKTVADQITSIGEEKKNLTPQDLPATTFASSSANAGDPLFTPEIDAGLSQLLSDWSLFKKSGLFGTGPKGKDHPLYKQIADLQIPLLLAGRFEGSTQEIKQSITDYMNGWRYEQGIIYEKGETFERYLRRVIKQILDLQKKRLSS